MACLHDAESRRLGRRSEQYAKTAPFDVEGKFPPVLEEEVSRPVSPPDQGASDDWIWLRKW